MKLEFSCWVHLRPSTVHFNSRSQAEMWFILIVLSQNFNLTFLFISFSYFDFESILYSFYLCVFVY